jgi:capsular polysaccharide biosynthesis protein
MRPGQRLRKSIFPLQRRLNTWLRRRLVDGGPPCGIYSEARAIADGSVEGGLLAKPEHCIPIPVDSEIRAAGLDQDKYRDWNAPWCRRDDVFLAAPSLAHSNDTGKVCLEAIYGPHAWSDGVWRRSGKMPIRRLSGDFTSIVSRWNDGRNYFHWFMDGLTRLIHLDAFPAECRILIPKNLPAFALRSLELLGLSGRVVETADEDLRIERYWFAGPTMLSGCPDPCGVEWLRRKFLPDRQPVGHRRLYIERNAPTRSLANAHELREFFRERDWEIIDPGTLTLDEQIGVFGEAQFIVGVHGAAMTNLLWAPAGARVLELMPKHRRNGCYAGIALVAGQDHRTIVCPSDRKGEISVPLKLIAPCLSAP